MLLKNCNNVSFTMKSLSDEPEITSPCVRKCCLNEQDICLGCYRSLNEIIDWAAADSVTRQRYLANAAQRKAKINANYL